MNQDAEPQEFAENKTAILAPLNLPAASRQVGSYTGGEQEFSSNVAHDQGASPQEGSLDLVVAPVSL